MENDTAFINYLYSNRIEPFLRWAGGKQSIISHLLKFLPKDLYGRLYIEPFLGAGSLFFALQPRVVLQRIVLTRPDQHTRGLVNTKHRMPRL